MYRIESFISVISISIPQRRTSKLMWNLDASMSMYVCELYKRFGVFPQRIRNIIARLSAQSTANKLRERNGTSLFGNARQGRDSLLDNWILVLALTHTRIYARCCCWCKAHRGVMGLRNDSIRLEHSATKAPDKQDGDLKK